MTALELQSEELEVLSSIYDGDNCFKQISSTAFQYKYGVHDDPKSFLIELRWGENYPEEKPEVAMDAFYNKHIIEPLKKKIITMVEEEAEQYLGMSMTYSLFEFVKEKFDEIIQEQPENSTDLEVDKLCISEVEENVSKKGPKKEQLTKAQKRRQWDKVDSKGEKPRGWNWVDIVKHLSQTGPKEDSPTS